MADLEQRTAAWYEARKGKLTASNLGAALGQVSYTSRAAALRRALGTDKFEGNAATDWGTQFEPTAIQQYESLTGYRVEATGLHTHPKYSWLAGSPDGLLGSEGMIEVKCPYYYFHCNSYYKLGKLPIYYYMQINALLEICDRQWCDYICWTPVGMQVYRVHRDEETFKYLLPFYEQFYTAIEAQAEKPPPLTPEQKDEITRTVKDAMLSTVDYKLTFAEEDEPPRKLQRII